VINARFLPVIEQKEQVTAALVFTGGWFHIVSNEMIKHREDNPGAISTSC
jgi:hypothetical protein